MRWISRLKMPKMKFLKRLAMKFAAKEIDERLATQIRSIRASVEEFKKPIKILENTLMECRSVILVRRHGNFYCYVLGDTHAFSFLKNNINILKIVHSSNLAEVFSKSDVVDADMATQMMRNTRLEFGKDVPDDVVQLFTGAMSGKYDE